jgi:UDP-3-O-[3-hydroxymyristoyl] glucosamine N-acyltransferase
MMSSDKRGYTTGELAANSDSMLVGDPDHYIVGMNTLQSACQQEISFLSNPAYQKDLAVTQAGCVILHPSVQALFDGNKLVADDPYYVFAQLTQLFVSTEGSAIGIHSSVVIGSDCQLADNIAIAPNTVIGNHVYIAADVKIGAGCYIGDNTRIGSGSIIHPNVSIYADTTLGDNVIVHSQVVIGADGFGFAPKHDGRGSWQKIYQLGGVEIGNDVEIGAGTTIDRGALDNTIIGDGVKLDNQIQIAHNVVIGENTAIAGTTAIAGSTVVGKRCTIAGAVGIIGHLMIADDVHITAMTLVTKSINMPGSYSSGTPLNKTSVWRKNAARFNRLDDSFRRKNK